MYLILAIGIALTSLAAHTQKDATETRALPKIYSDYMTAYVDCQMYDTILHLLRTDFSDTPTRMEDGKEMMQTPVAGANFCIVYHKSEQEAQPSMSCTWSKFGEAGETWANALYERRLNTLRVCQSKQKEVTTTLDNRLSMLKEKHFIDNITAESWSIGLMKTGQTWYVTMIAEFEAEEK